MYHKIPYAKKKGKDKFHVCVKKALGSVSIHHLRKFSAWACCYMLTYLLLDSSADGKDSNGQGLPFKDIELFVDHKMKVHQSCLDLEHGYISRVWKEAQGHTREMLS